MCPCVRVSVSQGLGGRAVRLPGPEGVSERGGGGSVHQANPGGRQLPPRQENSPLRPEGLSRRELAPPPQPRSRFPVRGAATALDVTDIQILTVKVGIRLIDHLFSEGMSFINAKTQFSTDTFRDSSLNFDCLDTKLSNSSPTLSIIGYIT